METTEMRCIWMHKSGGRNYGHWAVKSFTTCYIAQQTLLNTMYRSIWEKNQKLSEYMHTFN